MSGVRIPRSLAWLLLMLALLTAGLLRQEPFVWLRDLGIFAAAEGDFASHAAATESLEARVDAARREPFRSPRT